MPPRKSAKLAAEPASESSASGQRSSAETAYRCPEILAQILRHLPKKDLASFIRVERKVMAQVAEVLYFQMPYAHVMKKMKMSTTRQKMYLAAITEINARKLVLTPAMVKGIDMSACPQSRQVDRIAAYLRTFHIEIFNLLIPTLRKRCPRVRRILFGTVSSTSDSHSWVVHLDPLEDTTAPPTGTIDFGRTVEFSPWSDPPSEIPPPPAFPPGFTICKHTDITFKSGGFLGDSDMPTKWRDALREKAYFGEIASKVNLGDLSVTIGEVSELCARQKSNGSMRRSRPAKRIAPFAPRDLSTLGSVARTLNALILTDPISQSSRYGASRGISFADLPDMVTNIRASLPNLHELHFAADITPTAEKECLALLSKTSLGAGGSIKVLRVVTPRSNSPLFNILRYLARLCNHKAKKFSISVADRGLGSMREYKVQTAYVRHLRQQPFNRRKHLSTVDFHTLGVTTLSDTQHIARGKAVAWSLQAKTAADSVQQTLIPQLAAATHEISEAATSLNTTASTASAAHLAEAQRLLDAVDAIRAVGVQVQEAMGAVGSEKDLREYVDSLKRAVRVGDA